MNPFRNCTIALLLVELRRVRFENLKNMYMGALP